MKALLLLAISCVNLVVPGALATAAEPPTPTPIIQEKIVYDDIDPNLITQLRATAAALKTEIASVKAKHVETKDQLDRLEKLLDSVASEQEKITDLTSIVSRIRTANAQVATEVSTALKAKVDAFCERFSVARRIPLRRENSSTFTVPLPYFAHRIVFKGAVKPTTLTFSTKGRVIRTERVTASETTFAKPIFFTTLVVDPDTCPEFELFEAPRLVLGDEEL